MCRCDAYLTISGFIFYRRRRFFLISASPPAMARGNRSRTAARLGGEGDPGNRHRRPDGPTRRICVLLTINCVFFPLTVLSLFCSARGHSSHQPSLNTCSYAWRFTFFVFSESYCRKSESLVKKINRSVGYSQRNPSGGGHPLPPGRESPASARRLRSLPLQHVTEN